MFDRTMPNPTGVVTVAIPQDAQAARACGTLVMTQIAASTCVVHYSTCCQPARSVEHPRMRELCSFSPTDIAPTASPPHSGSHIYCHSWFVRGMAFMVFNSAGWQALPSCHSEWPVAATGATVRHSPVHPRH